MKLMRTLAMLLALVLMSTVCAFAETTDESAVALEAVLLPEMGLTYEDWLSTPDIRAIFAVLLQIEMSIYEEQFFVSEYLDTYGIPTLYLAELTDDLAGDAIALYMFYTDTEGTIGADMMVCCTYTTSTGTIVGSNMEIDTDPAQVMEILATENKTISTYYPITLEEYYTALLTVESIISGDAE